MHCLASPRCTHTSARPRGGSCQPTIIGAMEPSRLFALCGGEGGEGLASGERLKSIEMGKSFRSASMLMMLLTSELLLGR